MPRYRTLSDYAVDRDNNFNLIRFIAASLVLLSHSYALTGVAHDPLIAVSGIDFGHLAVDIFFVTSGFLVTGSLLKRANVRAFVRARFLRIVPGLLVANLITVFVIGLIFTVLPVLDYLREKDLYRFLFANTTLVLTDIRWTLPGVFMHNPFKDGVNGSLWTLPYEVKLYGVLLFAGILSYTRFKLLTPRALKLMLILATAVLVVYNLFDHYHNHRILNQWRLSGMFISGAAFFVLKDRIIMSFWAAAAMLALLLAFAAPLLSDPRFYVSYWLFLAYLIFYLAYVPKGPIRQFNKFGDYSYGIYIYAFPIQQGLVAAIPDLSPLQLFAGAFPITLLAAVTSWHFIEKAALSVKSSPLHLLRQARVPGLRTRGDRSAEYPGPTQVSPPRPGSGDETGSPATTRPGSDRQSAPATDPAGHSRG